MSNDKAINDAYTLFSSKGYSKSKDDFVELIRSNGNALNDAYALFSSKGYKGSVDDFSSLMGISESPKKKDDTESILEDGSSEPVETVEEKPLEDVLIESSFEDRDEKIGFVGNLVSSLDKGLYKNLIGNPVKGLGILLEGATGPGFASDALINFANYYNNAIDELTPQDEEFRGTLSDQFGQAFGQVAALAGTGFLTGAGKAGQILQMAKAPTTINIAKETGKQLINPVAVSGGMSMGASEFERAKESGATDDQAFEAFYKNAAVGSVLERIPMMQFFKRFNSATKGGVVNYLKTKGTAGVVGGTEEMITEVLQTIYANKTAKDIYNETQDLLEGVGESGGVGFGVGFILNALGARARLAKSEGNTSEAAAIEQAVIDFEQKNEERTRDEEIENGVKDEVRKGDPNLSDAQVDKIAPLQRELNNLESNNTEVAKLKKKQLREQIDQIINQEEDAVQERKTEEVPVGEQTPAGEEVVEEVREQATEEQDVQTEEVTDFDQDEVAQLEQEIEALDKDGSISDNVGKKAYMGSEEGMIKVDPENENTIIFETNDQIIEVPSEKKNSSLSSMQLSLMPQEGVDVVPEGDVMDVVSVDGKDYEFMQRSRDKKGKAVVKLKEVSTGLQRRFKGEKAERILKDMGLRTPKKPIDIPAVKKKPIETGKLEESTESKALKRDEFVKKTEEEVDQLIEQSEKDVADFESMVLDEMSSKESPRKALVESKGGIYQVTDKGDGSFSVSKMREDGKLTRSTSKEDNVKAVAQFKRARTKAENKAIKEAQELIDNFKKEESDKIEAALNKAIAATDMRGKAYDATLGIPMFMANSSLKIIKAAYKAGKTLSDAIIDGIDYLRSKGYDVSPTDYKKYVLQEIKTPASEKRERISPKPPSEESKSPKKSPSVNKLTGKKRKKVTVDEMAALKDQIRLEARAAKNAQKSLNDKRKSLGKSVRELIRKGKLTQNQASAITNKASIVNLNNPDAVKKFLEYVDKVYSNSEYADMIAKAESNRRRASKNIPKKLGVAKPVYAGLEKVFSISSKMIPDSVMDDYLSLVSQFGERKAVLNLENMSDTKKKIDNILNAVDEESSKIPSLQSAYNDAEKVINDDTGDVEYAATINAMVDRGEITSEEGDLMKKYKSSISPKENLKDESEFDPQEVVESIEIKDNNVTDPQSKEAAQDFLEAVRDKSTLAKLSENMLKNVQAVIDNIDAGYFPNYGLQIMRDIEAIKSSEKIWSKMPKKMSGFFDKVIAGAKRVVDKTISKELIQIRQNPLSYIDDLLGNIGGRQIYDNTFGRAARAYSKMDTELTKTNEKLHEADRIIRKSHRNKGNKVVQSKFNIMAYLIQKEFESNPDSKKVFSAKEAIEAINEAKKKKGVDSRYSNRDLNALNSIDANRDATQMYNDLTDAEKKAVKIIEEINDSIFDKADYTASVIRGSRPEMINSYVHHSVVDGYAKKKDVLSEQYNSFKAVGTKAGTIEERTSGAKAIEFDPLRATMNGVSQTLMDYHMTDPSKTVFKTINRIKEMALKSENDDQIAIANAIESAFDTAMSNVFERSRLGGDAHILNALKNTGYRALLASVPKAASELSVNLLYAAINNPKTFSLGVSKYSGLAMSTQDGRQIMDNLGSRHTAKTYGEKISGKNIDAGVFSEEGSIEKAESRSDVMDIASQISSYTLKPVANVTSRIADFLISSPDKVISRPLFFGSLDSKFKEITGKNIDMDKIASNDKQYMRENKEALKEATSYADQQVTKASTSVNPFDSILKNRINANDSAIRRAWKTVNSFMTNFQIYEYASARQGIQALINGGEISRGQGALLLAATTARMTMYSTLLQFMYNMYDPLLAWATDSDIGEEQEDDYIDQVKRALAGTTLSMFVGKTMGNVSRIPIAWAAEYFNEEYLEDLRNGDDYDPFKHSITFSMLSREDISRGDAGDWIAKMAGPLSPFAKTSFRTAELIAKANNGSLTKKQRDQAIEELESRMILEGLGNMGYVAFYKDIRRVVLKDMYKNYGKDGKISSETLKEYAPDVYKIRQEQKARLKKMKEGIN